MKIVFFGTPPFAAQILEYLIDQKVDVLAVVCQPDRQRENRSPLVPAVKKTAQKLIPDIPVLQPEKASNEAFLDELETFDADLFIVVAYGQILKKRLLQMPKMDCINVHGSLLPKYRGAAPIQRAIMEGEKETGITIMKVVAKMDAGEMIRKASTSITEEMTYGQLEKTLCDLSKPLLFEVIKDFEKGAVSYEKQDESLVTFANKITEEDCRIDWNLSAEKLHDQIRGLSPRPGAFTQLLIEDEKKRIKILNTQVVTENLSPGELVVSESKNILTIGCKENALKILSLQMEGKKAMSIEEFLRGWYSKAVNSKIVL